MTFNDEQKQAEFDAFAPYFAAVSKRPVTAASRSLLNQLRTIAVGQFGNGAYQELLRANRREVPLQPERTGKPTGGGNNRRNQSPTIQKAPQQGSPRWLRNQARGVGQSGKSAAPAVVAAGETAESLIEGTKRLSKKIANAGVTADELTNIHLSTGAEFNTETGRTENDLMQDAAALGWKELIEKHGRELMFEALLNAGHDGVELEQKSDRQLANLLKKEAEK